MGRTRFLGVVLVLAALTASAQGQTSVTLAWDPDAGTNIAGYKIYYGVASRTYTNTNNVGNVTNATISGLISGTNYYFAATAYDTSGLESAYSNEAVYTNQAAAPPTIVLSSPVSGASYTAPAAISLAATVTANGHTITQVQFYNGATLLGTVAAAPYSFSWTNVSAGSYSLTAQAVYDSGSTVASTSANVTVTNLPLPSIALTAPANGAGYTAPAAISLAATRHRQRPHDHPGPVLQRRDAARHSRRGAIQLLLDQRQRRQLQPDGDRRFMIPAARLPPPPQT